MKGRFEGIIQKVNAPKYSEKYGVWSISLKENGKWTSVWRKDQSKADELYRLLVKRMKSNGLGMISNQQHSLRSNWRSVSSASTDSKPMNF